VNSSQLSGYRLASVLSYEVHMKRIMMVEDNRQLCDAYSMALAKVLKGCAVEIAFDGALAAALMEHKEYDLIITDMNMPVLDGRGLYLRAQEICAREAREMPPFIFCSGVKSALDGVTEFCRDTANSRMLKPFRLAELVAAVKKTLSERECMACVP